MSAKHAVIIKHQLASVSLAVHDRKALFPNRCGFSSGGNSSIHELNVSNISRMRCVCCYNTTQLVKCLFWVQCLLTGDIWHASDIFFCITLLFSNMTKVMMRSNALVWINTSMSFCSCIHDTGSVHVYFDLMLGSCGIFSSVCMCIV